MLPEEEKRRRPGEGAGKRRGRRRRGKKWAWRSKPWVWYPLFLLRPAIILFCCQLATLQSAAEVFAWMGGCFGAAAFTYALLLALVVLLLALTRSLFFSTLLVGAPAPSLSLASHFEEVANGVPPAGQRPGHGRPCGGHCGLHAPGDGPGGGTWWSVGVLAALLLVIALFGHRMTRAQGWGWYGRTVSGLLAVLVLLGQRQSAPAAAFLRAGDEIRPSATTAWDCWPASERHSGQCRPGAGRLQREQHERHSGGGRHAAEQSAPTAADGVRPNVILLMSEASATRRPYSPAWTSSTTPSPITAHWRRWPSGQFLSNTYAGGTGNVEMEVMTGVPIAFVGRTRTSRR